MNTTRSHVILGGNGVIGRETARALISRGDIPLSVSRHPSSVPGARSSVADLLVAGDVFAAVAGADVAYLTVGVPYSRRAWAAQWPVILRNCIDAAVAHGTHLVYFDNVYAYGRVTGAMKEQTPVGPDSKKGVIRAALLSALAAAGADRGLKYTVARSADFYGPDATTSVFNSFVIDPIAAGKTATWFFDADQPHSLTYTPDIGDALATLGIASRPGGEVWHLPTAAALTGREYVRLAAGADAKLTVMSATTMRIGALFVGDAREALEMRYQDTEPYVFDSSAFERTFGSTPTPVRDGIRESLAAARS